MFTLFMFFASSTFMGGAMTALMFWVLTAVVVWGLVDMASTPATKFEAARQSIAWWLVALFAFGPLACGGWLVVRRSVKNAPSSAPTVRGSPHGAEPYPYAQERFIPAHLDGHDEVDGGPPPLR